MTAAHSHLVDVAQRIRESAAALGAALDAVDVYIEPSVARAVQAERNLYDRIDAEFGLLTSTEAGRRMGSKSTAPRNLAAAVRRDKALLAIARGRQTLFPGFQFGADGRPLPVIRALRELADEAGWSESAVVQWLCAPTTYLDELRPVDLLAGQPERVLDAARRAWSVRW
ncbi:hypothetical protein [Mycolicibacterium duvalii]|uniref:Antitoxin Xre/MbcA/ParS-like toxin-binding domain-containing protein n=1 Tax=Mycolicibacterium duvalii TaxID=39688 RepID=A0A7I7JWS5_9MYCO|nr:hypothetical protein [Mycolicibacterium duvalii]MCV7369544.1 hypothetical protein [Mycolicibacterium duvalii]BBX16265.1 hypothetical protein MDUV_11250 [Mycolicibacterium duvalii]